MALFFKTPEAKLAIKQAKKSVDQMVKTYGFQTANWSIMKRLDEHQTKVKFLKEKEQLENKLAEINKKI